MRSKAIFTIVVCFIFVVSCRDNESRNEQEPLNTEETEFSPVDRNIPREDVEEDDFNKNTGATGESTDNASRDTKPGERGNQNTGIALSGQYIKNGQEADSNCGCYCLDLSTGTTELCLVEGKMYINARLEKNSDNTIDVYLVDPAARNTEGKDIPWQQFDRNSTIATIKPKSNGELEFDWLGFKINGDLAVDYAIFGKKTLEGSYKKK